MRRLGVIDKMVAIFFDKFHTPIL